MANLKNCSSYRHPITQQETLPYCKIEVISSYGRLGRRDRAMVTTRAFGMFSENGRGVPIVGRGGQSFLMILTRVCAISCDYLLGG